MATPEGGYPCLSISKLLVHALLCTSHCTLADCTTVAKARCPWVVGWGLEIGIALRVADSQNNSRKKQW